MGHGDHSNSARSGSWCTAERRAWTKTRGRLSHLQNPWASAAGFWGSCRTEGGFMHLGWATGQSNLQNFHWVDEKNPPYQKPWCADIDVYKCEFSGFASHMFALPVSVDSPVFCMTAAAGTWAIIVLAKGACLPLLFRCTFGCTSWHRSLFPWPFGRLVAVCPVHAWCCWMLLMQVKQLTTIWLRLRMAIRNPKPIPLRMMTLRPLLLMLRDSLVGNLQVEWRDHPLDIQCLRMDPAKDLHMSFLGETPHGQLLTVDGNPSWIRLINLVEDIAPSWMKMILRPQCSEGMLSPTMTTLSIMMYVVKLLLLTENVLTPIETLLPKLLMVMIGSGLLVWKRTDQQDFLARATTWLGSRLRKAHGFSCRLEPNQQEIPNLQMAKWGKGEGEETDMDNHHQNLHG